MREAIQLALSAGVGATIALLATKYYDSRKVSKKRRAGWHSSHTLADGTTSLTIRTAATADIPAVFELIYSLAVVCGEGHEMQVDARAIALAFDAEGFEALVATTIDGTVVAMAVVQESYRTFSGNSLYLQDLIVDGRHRGSGIGTLLFRQVAAFALRRGCNRLFWESVVGEANRANDFYKETIGAEQVVNHLNWRIDGIEALATCARIPMIG